MRHRARSFLLLALTLVALATFASPVVAGGSCFPLNEFHKARLMKYASIDEPANSWTGVFGSGYQGNYRRDVAWWLWANEKGDMSLLVSRLGNINNQFAAKLRSLDAKHDDYSHLDVLPVPGIKAHDFCSPDSGECNRDHATTRAIERLGLEHYGLESCPNRRLESNDVLKVRKRNGLHATPRVVMDCQQMPRELADLAALYLQRDFVEYHGRWPAFARLIRMGITEGGRYVWMLTSNTDATPTLWMLNMGSPLTDIEAGSLVDYNGFRITRAGMGPENDRDKLDVDLKWNMVDTGFCPLDDAKPSRLEQAYIKAASEMRNEHFITLIACSDWRAQAMARAKANIESERSIKAEAEGDADAGRVWAEGQKASFPTGTPPQPTIY